VACGQGRQKASDGAAPRAAPGPDLQWRDAEVRFVTRTLRPGRHTTLSGPQADRSHWSASSPDTTHTHYAGHATYDWKDPLGSAVLLAGGELTLGDLLDEAIPLRRSELTALAACETTMTDPDDPADEYLGLASGFVFAGCPVVLSTLWRVKDDAALLLSARFYQELRAHRRPSTALTAAQRWLRSAGHRRSPPNSAGSATAACPIASASTRRPNGTARRP